MAGKRESRLVPFILLPGYYTNATDRMASGRFVDGNRVRFHKGLPEKIEGWQRIDLTDGTPDIAQIVLFGSNAGTENDLNWVASTGDHPIAGYRLFDADTDVLIIDTASTSYAHTGLSAGTYNYYVVSYDTAGTVSARSNIVSLSVASIVTTGKLVLREAATVSTGTDPFYVAVIPSGLYAYVINFGVDSISQYSISSGLLTPLSPATVATGDSPNGIVIAPSGLYAYVTNIFDSTISQYSISSGLLTPLSPATVAAGNSPKGIVIAPSGLYAYVANASDSTISQYSISSGLLTPLSPATVAAGSGCDRIKISADGLHLYVVNTDDSTISQYSISSGLLTPLSPATVATGNNPTGIALTPDGLYAYAVNSGSATVSQYLVT